MTRRARAMRRSPSAETMFDFIGIFTMSSECVFIFWNERGDRFRRAVNDLLDCTVFGIVHKSGDGLMMWTFSMVKAWDRTTHQLSKFRELSHLFSYLDFSTFRIRNARTARSRRAVDNPLQYNVRVKRKK